MKLLNGVYWKTLGVLLAAAFTLAAQAPFFGRGLGFGGTLGAFTRSTVTGAPFSAQWNLQSQRTLANGNQIQTQEQANIYRDSQGRVRIDTTITSPASSGQTQTMTTIFDPVAGYVYRLNPQKMTGVQAAIQQRPAPSGRAPNRPANSQVQTQNLGTQNINGVAATGTQVTRTIPAGTIGNSAAIQIVRVTWVSAALQVPVQVTVTDPRSGNQTMNLTNIVTAEPNASLFVVPSEYTITSGRAGAQFRRH
jgi:hypothetical protein